MAFDTYELWEKNNKFLRLYCEKFLKDQTLLHFDNLYLPHLIDRVYSIIKHYECLRIVYKKAI